MKRLIGAVLLCAVFLASLVGCSANGNTVGGLDVEKARPLLDAAAEATASSIGGAGFEGQMSASFFTDLVTAALRDGALTAQNSPVSINGSTCVIRSENQQSLYQMMGAVGSFPGFSGSNLSIRADSVALTIAQRHPLMPKMHFEVTGVSPSTDYEGGFSLTAVLRGENELTGQVEYGRYTVIVLPNAGTPFGCTLAAVRAQSSILAPAGSTANTTADDPATATTQPSTETQTPNLDAPLPSMPAVSTDDLSGFFGYAATDALEDWSPILRAAADSCLKLEYNLTGEPDGSMLWYIIGGAVSAMGSQLPGVSVGEVGYTMLSDDMIVTMGDLFLQPPAQLPDIPDRCTAFVSVSDNVYVFTLRDVASFHITQYQVEDDTVVFTMSDAQNHRVNVALAKNELSGYGVSIAQATILP